MAERIQKNVREHHFRIKDNPISVTLSIGLFSFQDLERIDTSTFIEKADQALLQAKRLGKDRIFSAEAQTP